MWQRASLNILINIPKQGALSRHYPSCVKIASLDLYSIWYQLLGRSKLGSIYIYSGCLPVQVHQKAVLLKDLFWPLFNPPHTKKIFLRSRKINHWKTQCGKEGTSSKKEDFWRTFFWKEDFGRTGRLPEGLIIASTKTTYYASCVVCSHQIIYSFKKKNR